MVRIRVWMVADVFFNPLLLILKNKKNKFSLSLSIYPFCAKETTNGLKLKLS